MKKFLVITLALAITACSQPASEKEENKPYIDKPVITQAIDSISHQFPDANQELIKRGVTHAASLWRAEDGTPSEFVTFCSQKFIGAPSEKEQVFLRISAYLESLYGHFNKISLDLQKNVHEQTGPLLEIDHEFAAYSAGAHLNNDFYENKMAFLIALNFPYYTTEEKNELGGQWSSLEWAYARLGDIFSSRIPANLIQQAAKVSAQADAYIAEYNIFMGHLLNDKNEKLFPDDMVLLSHWNLRDEIKANYANTTNGLEKQALIYQVMKRIIDQSIPAKVINSGEMDWNPATNEVFSKGTKSESTPEPDSRYQQILNNFKAFEAMDVYNPVLNTAIKRSFSAGMQIPQPEVEQLFDQFLSAPQVKAVADLIKKRLVRDLEPWDIWYDGFKARSSIAEDKLNAITQKKYPNAAAFEADMPNMLRKLGFSNEKAAFLASQITVDTARGSGHAWGASMKSEKAHLRTRIPETGMNYKGYNIAVHEFGHNVEQTISLHEVPYYMLNGVPNTAFTEALAFVFQERDLFLLDMKDTNPDKDFLKTLDIFWSVYEIMGVSMVDMKMWQWLYANPACTASQLKEAVLQISKDVWNKYYAPAFGKTDEPILAIYSHMVNSPMYLPNYAFGHLIHFQLEEYFKTHPLAPEVERIFSLGQLTPNEWMQKAVGTSLSNEPLLNAAQAAVDHFKQRD